ncbi:MAG: hypothetical protein ACYC6R_03565 [Anaerolineales bacterium]
MTGNQNTFPLRTVVQLIVVVLIAPFIPMIVSSRWDWWQAWSYAIASILAFAISRVFVARKHPNLIAERARFMQAKDTKHGIRSSRPCLDWDPF